MEILRNVGTGTGMYLVAVFEDEPDVVQHLLVTGVLQAVQTRPTGGERIKLSYLINLDGILHILSSAK